MRVTEERPVSHDFWALGKDREWLWDFMQAQGWGLAGAGRQGGTSADFFQRGQQGFGGTRTEKGGCALRRNVVGRISGRFGEDWGSSKRLGRLEGGGWARTPLVALRFVGQKRRARTRCLAKGWFCLKGRTGLCSLGSCRSYHFVPRLPLHPFLASL